MATHNKVGIEGEQQAVDFLIKNGCKILERNWRFHKAEIDIIALDKQTLVIVEVKTRTKAIFAKPYESVTKAKQNLLIEAANAYIENNDITQEARFDIISIVGNEIEHLKHAFYP